MVLDGRTRRTTSADVAHEAGVSRATVSYVLNDTPHQKIPEHTRRRVLEAAARLGYTPSAAARVLRSGRSDVVLLLLPDWPIGPAIGRFLEEMSGMLAAAGFTLVAHPQARTSRPASEVWKAITPAAVVTFGDFDEEEAAALQAAGIDLTVTLLGRARRRAYELEAPQQHVGRVQAEHLAVAGHRRLGYAWPDDSRVLDFAEPRLDGVRLACADLGLDEPVVRTVPLEPCGAADAVGGWRDAQVTAVCAYNDDVALAVLAGMRRHGLTAPRDLAVIGADDIPAAALTEPPLTTVMVDELVTARYVTDRLVAALAGNPPPPGTGCAAISVVRRDSA